MTRGCGAKIPLQRMTDLKNKQAPGVGDIVREVTAGAIPADQPTLECLDRIQADDARIKAWTFVDPDLAARRAEALVAQLHKGALAGVPIGLKDIIDTDDMPTENGTPVDAGRRPERSATIAERLRAAGAVTIGKTVTTELAFMHPGPTRNPHDTSRTPGGSSSGSAAAVAAGMVPAAIGTQTGGSMLRPASFCGVVGYKPSHGAIARGGVLMTSRTLDTLGIFARSVEDVARVAAACFGADDRDPWSRESSGRDLVAGVLAEPPVAPRLAFVRGPAWERAEPTTHEAFGGLIETLGDRIVEIDLPEIFDQTLSTHRTVMAAELAAHVGHYIDRAPDQMSADLHAIIEEGRRVNAVDYLAALDARRQMNIELAPTFDRFDALVTPAAAGEALTGLGFTGDSSFLQLGSLTGAPAISLPLLKGPNNLPLGVQLIGPRNDDLRLLRVSAWLMRHWFQIA